MERQRSDNAKEVEGTYNLPALAVDPRDKELMFRGLPHGEEQAANWCWFLLHGNKWGRGAITRLGYIPFCAWPDTFYRYLVNAGKVSHQTSIAPLDEESKAQKHSHQGGA